MLGGGPGLSVLFVGYSGQLVGHWVSQDAGLDGAADLGKQGIFMFIW